MVVIFIPPKNLFHLCALRLININKKKNEKSSMSWPTVNKRTWYMVWHWFPTTVYVRLAVSFDDVYTCIITLYL